MIDDLIPSPLKDFTPRANPPKQSVTEKTQVKTLTDDELRKLAREKLSEALQVIDPRVQPEMTRKLCAELLDRLDGKPGQSVTLDATVKQVIVNATIRFADEIPLIDNEMKTIEHNIE